MTVPHLDVDGFVGVGIAAMPSCLLDKLPPMNKDECLSGDGIGSFDAIDELCEDDLMAMSIVADSIEVRLTVLPLPVAREIPSRLWPFLR